MTNNDAAQPTGVGEAPERIYLQARFTAKTLAEQVMDGGIWHYEGGPNCIEYIRADLAHPSPSDVSERARRAVAVVRERASELRRMARAPLLSTDTVNDFRAKAAGCDEAADIIATELGVGEGEEGTTGRP